MADPTDFTKLPESIRWVAKVRPLISKLDERGVDFNLHKGPPVSELLDLLGNLTVFEIANLVDLAACDRGIDEANALCRKLGL